MAYVINDDCANCGSCAAVCPAEPGCADGPAECISGGRIKESGTSPFTKEDVPDSFYIPVTIKAPASEARHPGS